MTHTAENCTIETHDHFGQIEAAQNFGMPAPDSDELVCFDCARKIYYDYADELHHHLTEPERGCFLIPPEIKGEFVRSGPPRPAVPER